MRETEIEVSERKRKTSLCEVDEVKCDKSESVEKFKAKGKVFKEDSLKEPK